ncbi:MAG: hypothetical protein HRU34_03930 [Richelia sp.]|nr:hypothetical protein [Richelia sp.]
MASGRIPTEAVIELRCRLALLPSRSRERRVLIQSKPQLYGVSEQTLYRIIQ